MILSLFYETYNLLLLFLQFYIFYLELKLLSNLFLIYLLDFLYSSTKATKFIFSKLNVFFLIIKVCKHLLFPFFENTLFEIKGGKTIKFIFLFRLSL